jgi:hypothetical protein
MSASAREANIERLGQHVRFGPETDLRAAAERPIDDDELGRRAGGHDLPRRYL